MSEKSSQPSQVQLFSEQISEQIGRLRVLTGAESRRADTVAVKRAVMATRLLAGGARALRLETLPIFLEELLAWLQDIQRAGRPASPTQTLILEAVVELEEALMRHLEADEEGTELSSFDEEISELRTLIRHNQESMATAEPAEESVTLEPEPDEVNTHAGQETKEKEGLVEQELAPFAAGTDTSMTMDDQVLSALGTLADWLSKLDARQAEDLRSHQDACEELHRLHAVLETLLQDAALPSHEPTQPKSSASAEAVSPAAEVPELVAPSPPESHDPFIRGLVGILQERRDTLNGRLDFSVDGSVGALEPEAEQKLNRVLDHLLEDSCDMLEQMLEEEDAPPRGRLELHLSSKSGRLRISLRDNGPQLEATPALDHVDPLGLYRGLRRSRGLIEELHGIILVEPSDQPGTRFVLSLPTDPQHPVVRVMDLGAVSAALPGLLIDDYLSTDGLLFHRDTDGEHFVRNGHPVPLVDLAQYVAGVEPMAEEATGIVIVGSVEKLLGIYCYGLAENVELASSEEVVEGWSEVSARSIELKGKRLPLLSVTRLIRLRMEMVTVEEPGSVHDPVLDMYVELEAQNGFENTREVSSPSSRRVLLVNNSEFRRRELARTLELKGYRVTAVRDISSGLRSLKTQAVEFIVSDLRLGREETVSFENFRRACPSVPVILSSSVERHQAEELAHRSGADACWLEPYRGAELNSILNSLG